MILMVLLHQAWPFEAHDSACVLLPHMSWVVEMRISVWWWALEAIHRGSLTPLILPNNNTNRNPKLTLILTQSTLHLLSTFLQVPCLSWEHEITRAICEDWKKRKKYSVPQRLFKTSQAVQKAKVLLTFVACSNSAVEKSRLIDSFTKCDDYAWHDTDRSNKRKR